MTNELNKQIDDALTTLIDYQGSEPVIMDIGKIITSLSSRDIDKWTGDELSRASMKLSLLLCSLSPIMEAHKYKHNKSYVFRKVKSAQRFFEITDEKTVKGKEMMCQKELAGVYENEIAEGFMADSLTAIYRNVERICSNLQSRMKMIISERIQSNNQ